MCRSDVLFRFVAAVWRCLGVLRFFGGLAVACGCLAVLVGCEVFMRDRRLGGVQRSFAVREGCKAVAPFREAVSPFRRSERLFRGFGSHMGLFAAYPRASAASPSFRSCRRFLVSASHTAYASPSLFRQCVLTLLRDP